jgi:nucleoside-diphosphate-sugar epimerase
VITAITGADGYIGRGVLRVVLENSDDEVLAFVRAKDAQEFAQKSASLALELGPLGRRVRCQALNLPGADGLNETPTSNIRHIIHGAAVTEFNVERGVAEAVNLAGTRAVLQFAKRCQNLERVVLVSTIYSSGLRAGEIDEAGYDDSRGFANHYEWSKWAAESLLTREFNDLPWQVQRLATVLCDDAQGRVVQFNVVHKMWRLLYSGLLPLLPGSPSTPLYFVSGEFAYQAVWRLLREASDHSFFHICNSRPNAISTQELLDLAFDAFGKDVDFCRRRVLRPLFADESSFVQLADTAAMFSRDTLGTIIGLMRPFAKQMFIEKAFRTERTRSVVGDFSPDWPRLVQSACRHLLESRWGLSV